MCNLYVLFDDTNRLHGMYVYVYMYWCMTTSMYCLYVGVDYTYIYLYALAQGIKSFLASQVWFQAAITSQPR